MKLAETSIFMAISTIVDMAETLPYQLEWETPV